jgi:hypothetical protein
VWDLDSNSVDQNIKSILYPTYSHYLIGFLLIILLSNCPIVGR